MRAQGKPDITAGPNRLPRRKFLGTLAGGLVVLLQTSSLEGADTPDEQRLEVWLHVGADGMVTGFTGKVEFGQATRTGFTQVIAEDSFTFF